MSVVPGEDSESEEEWSYELPSEDKHDDSNPKHIPSEVKGTIVSGEDPETDDEVTTATSTAAQQNVRTVVSGEESETDEEEDQSTVPTPKVPTVEAQASKGKKKSKLSSSEKKGSQPDVKREPFSKTESQIKLRAQVVSFYQQVHTRLTGVYQTIAKNLIGINDSLSQAQQLVEKLNISVKHRERDLQKLNQELATVNETLATLAPNMKERSSSATQHRPKLVSQP